MPCAGHSTTSWNGSSFGSGQSQNEISQWRPPPPPPRGISTGPGGCSSGFCAKERHAPCSSPSRRPRTGRRAAEASALVLASLRVERHELPSGRRPARAGAADVERRARRIDVDTARTPARGRASARELELERHDDAAARCPAGRTTPAGDARAGSRRRRRRLEEVAHARLSSSATVSTCGVCGNMSTGRARTSS